MKNNTKKMKVRREWKINPVERVHGEGKLKKKYDRNREKRNMFNSDEE